MYPRALFGGTTFYLLLPNLLFLGFWFQPLVSIAIVLLVLAVWSTIFQYNFKIATKVRLTFWGHAILAFMALVICLFSGIGGFVFQGDFEKHYAMLHDLVYFDWPVIYIKSDIGGSVHLNYYFAYFLPPAAIAKILGVNLVDNLIIIWSAIGLYLSFLWFICLSGSRNIIWALSFLLFLGGQDFLYAWLKLQLHGITGNDISVARQIFDQEIRAVCVFHNTILRYPTNFFAISWAPQHLIGGWLLTSLLINNYLNNESHRFTIYLISLLPLWSIFNVIGLLPVIIVGIYQCKRDLFTWQNGVGLLILILVTVFFAAHHQVADQGPIWDYISLGQLSFKWLLFILFEFGYIALATYYFDYDLKYKRLFYFSVFFLAILPVYVIGNMNDLLMRAAVPSIFIINLIAFKVFIKVKHKVKYIVMAFVFLGILLPQLITISSYMPKVMAFHLNYGFSESRVRIRNSKSLYDLTGENWFNLQYFGEHNSLYMQYFSPSSDK